VVVLTGFVALLAVGYTVVTLLRLFERLEIALGVRRGAKH
jgi:hypothetical protein